MSVPNDRSYHNFPPSLVPRVPKTRPRIGTSPAPAPPPFIHHTRDSKLDLTHIHHGIQQAHPLHLFLNQVLRDPPPRR
ncbi:hypothetical protein BDN67DRAFT_643693 [Paxillus ammoniavirescens]|nr:hypothetical protein BDN67DRAFT_643693 [Paxillus ammoniavirescens]